MKHYLTNEILKILCHQPKENIKYEIKRDYITYFHIVNKKTKEEIEIHIAKDEITIDGESMRAQMRAEAAIRHTLQIVIDFCK